MSTPEHPRGDQGPTAEFIDHATHPRNIGELERADAVGEYCHDCGDRVTFYLQICNNQVELVRYIPQSCIQTLACVSAASTLIEGRSPLEARRRVTAETISKTLGGLPPEQMHCAQIAARAVWAAVDDYIATQREPWRRLYR